MAFWLGLPAGTLILVAVGFYLRGWVDRYHRRLATERVRNSGGGIRMMPRIYEGGKYHD